MELAVILAGAGEGRRMEGHGPKLLLDLDGRTMLDRAASAFAGHPAVGEIVAVVPEALLAQARRALASVPRPDGRFVRLAAVAGGSTRQESVRLGLAALSGESSYVAVHDVARAASRTRPMSAEGAAIPAIPIRDTVKEVDEGRVLRSPPRERLWAAQTPQIFARAILARAHEHGRGNAPATDDASLVEALGLPVAVVSGEPTNLKLTDPNDLIVAQALARSGRDGGD